MESKPILITNVSTSYFSVARYHGGATIQGESYVYCPERDILIKRDWLKIYKKLQWKDFVLAVKSGKKPKLQPEPNQNKQKIKSITQSLFDL